MAHEVTDRITYNAFLRSYRLEKEEIANKKLLSLIELEKHIGVVEMADFRNRSERSRREMRLLVGQNEMAVAHQHSPKGFNSPQ